MKNKNETRKTVKRGFMCQSTAAAVVCTTDDLPRVVVPRKLYSSRTLVDDPSKTKLISPDMTSGYARIDKPSSPQSYLGNIIRYETRSTQHDRHRIKGSAEVNPDTTNSSQVPENVFQVVVMRVSLHCQGCAGKVKKHLSKMEGVTSFSIDLETKMVTVRGHISPVEILESISKVKRAEFWS